MSQDKFFKGISHYEPTKNSGIAILIGLDKVDPSKYAGSDGKPWKGELPGCELGVDKVEEILKSTGFSNIEKRKTETAKADTVLSLLKKAAKTAKKGDIVVFYFAGHGGSQLDTNKDEKDKKDETIACYDRSIVDDELGAIWPTFKAGVRIVVLTDSCHSGTNIFSYPGLLPAPTFGLQNKKNNNVNAAIIHIGACHDKQFSWGEKERYFTQSLYKIWDHGNFRGDYQSFYKKIKDAVTKLAPKSDQIPVSESKNLTDTDKKPIPEMPGQTVQWHTYGSSKDLGGFITQKPPFTVDPPPKFLIAPTNTQLKPNQTSVIEDMPQTNLRARL